jgi:hypothetical protein
MRKHIRVAMLAAAAATPFATQAYGPDDFLSWVKINQDAQPQFVDGRRHHL